MATKEEILSTFDSKEGAWWAYREGIQIGYNEALNSLRNQAAIAVMQGILTNNYLHSVSNYTPCSNIAEQSVIYADALIEELKKK